MEIPFLILIMYLGTAITIFLSGLVMGIKKINGAPMMCIFSGVLIFGMLAITDDINAEGLTGKKTEFVVQNITNYMDQQTSTGSTTLCGACTNTFFGEQVVNSQSALYQKEINYFQTRLDKDLVPTGDMYIGVWNGVVNPTSTNYKFLISQMHANETNLAQMDYTFIRNDSKTYRLQVDDVIGIFYNGGSSGNQINMYSNATTTTFDGTNSLQSRFQRTTNTWIDGASGADLRGKIGLIEDIGKTQHEPFDFNNSDMWVYQTFMAVFFIFTGIVFQLQEWKP